MSSQKSKMISLPSFRQGTKNEEEWGGSSKDLSDGYILSKTNHSVSTKQHIGFFTILKSYVKNVKWLPMGVDAWEFSLWSPGPMFPALFCESETKGPMLPSLFCDSAT